MKRTDLFAAELERVPKQFRMANLEEARRLIAEYAEEYNTQRLHSALNYLTPADYLKGPEYVE